MASSTDSETHTSPETTAKTKTGLNRKLRTPKACYPCYKRKVKCDRNLPCSLCVKRGYADLCTFTHPPTTKERAPSPTPTARESCHSQKTKRSCCDVEPDRHPTETRVAKKPMVTESGNVLIDPEEWQHIQERLAVLSQGMQSLRSQLETALTSSDHSSPKLSIDEGSSDGPSPRTPLTIDDEKMDGVRTRNALGGSPVHCGSQSVTAFLLEKGHQRSVFKEEGVLSQLALDNESATYPFLDLWSSNITSYSNESVCAVLPDDSICRRLLRSYHDVRSTLYPVITDFDQFQKDVHTFLDNRALQNICPSNGMNLAAPYGFNISFIGILFAVLGAGCQVSEFSKNERVSMCRLYISCAYQCLRNGNFLSRPNMESIQTLLIIGDVLSYNMNPGIAYVTFGVAQRMALTLGLHAESSILRRPDSSPRQELWWSMAWQDSHFGLSYDRPVETLSPSPPIPRAANSKPGNRAYFETMCSVISLILQLLREEILVGSKVNDHTIPAYKTELDKILADAAPHLRSEDYCFTIKDHIERLTLKLRSSYLVSEICRRSLKKVTREDGKEMVMGPHLCQECIDSLISTIESYIEMHQIIPHGSRSWIHLHSAISSAFLLSVDEGAQSEPDVWMILEKLEKVFSDLTSAANNNNNSSNKPHPSDRVPYSPDAGRDWPSSFSSTPLNPPSSLSGIGGDFFSDNLGSFGQTFMLSDFPLSADSMMLGGGGGEGGKGAFDSRTMPVADGGVEFLTGTLNSLQKINAAFRVQKAERRNTKVVEKKLGACCPSRSREGTSGRCHSGQRAYT